MSLTGRGSLSLRKKDVQEQKSIAVGFKKLMFAHKATLADTGIDLSSLVTPSEMAGFVNPSTNDLLSSNLLFFRKNLTLVSSLKGLLVDYLSYNIATSGRINFQDFTAEDGEIFIGIIDASPRTQLQMVDASAIVATGDLAIGVTDFNVGTPFSVNKYPLAQVGDVLVFRNGQQQFRNPGNTTTGGNYQEVQGGGGLGTIIRFNNAPVSATDSILVVSNGLIAERPDGSMMAVIESLAGQVDQMIPTLADLAGVDETEFQAQPNNQDLKAFGDRVLDLENTVYPDPTILACESSQFPLGTVGYATGEAAQMTGNSVTLTPGLWRIHGTIVHGGSGTETSTRKSGGIFDSNGDNSTLIASKTDLTVPTYGFNRFRTLQQSTTGINENTVHIHIGPFYLRVLTSKTIYAVGGADFTVAGGAAIQGLITAEKIRD